MKKFLVIGNPIEHSLSPKLHNFWIKQNKLEAIYEKKLVSKNELKLIIESVRKNEIEGVNVTVPFKESIIDYLDIIISYNNKHLEVELYEWFHFPEDMHEENFNEVIFSCFFNKGLNKLDLDNVTTLLFAFVYMGGELGSLEKLDKTENITTL